MKTVLLFRLYFLASKEARDPARSVPRALKGSFLYLFLSMIAISIFNVLVAPGTEGVGDSSFPFVAVMEAVYGDRTISKNAAAAIGYLVILPSLFANLLGMLWCTKLRTEQYENC